MANVHIFTGPMGSGKTSMLLSELHKFANVTKDTCLLIGYRSDDKRYNDIGITTHMYKGKISVSENIRIEYTQSLKELSDIIDQYNVVGIDEGQFYSDLCETVRKYLPDNKKHIYISGLTQDSDNKSFGQISELLNDATTFKKMTAYCSDCPGYSFTPACMTACIVSDKNDQVKIGGLNDTYKPLCRYHYNLHISKNN